MDRDEAADVLGVEPGIDVTVLRATYRRLLHDHHPDHAADRACDDEDLTGRTARIIEAYATLRTQPPTAAAEPSFEIAVVADDTVALDLPAEEVFMVLLDTAHEIGDVTYVDVDAGLLEAIVHFEGTPVCSLVMSLQGRADRIEAWCTIESLDANEPPPVADVVRLLADLVRTRAYSRATK